MLWCRVVAPGVERSGARVCSPLSWHSHVTRVLLDAVDPGQNMRVTFELKTALVRNVCVAKKADVGSGQRVCDPVEPVNLAFALVFWFFIQAVRLA